jgi:hypothetical protein
MEFMREAYESGRYEPGKHLTVLDKEIWPLMVPVDKRKDLATERAVLMKAFLLS